MNHTHMITLDTIYIYIYIYVHTDQETWRQTVKETQNDRARKTEQTSTTYATREEAAGDGIDSRNETDNTKIQSN